jgi:hypothetical protein
MAAPSGHVEMNTGMAEYIGMTIGRFTPDFV